jgi:hypothetical protein
MKTFKKFLEESTVIKLRGFSGPDRSESFMNDLESSTEEHPFDHNARVYNKKASVKVSPRGRGAVHMHDVRAIEPGGGSEALEHLKSLADKHNVEIHGIAKAYSISDKYPMNSKNLAKYYKKRRFKVGEGNKYDGYPIRYEPKGRD